MALYKTLVRKVSIPPDKKTKQKDYQKQGKLAIIDQGQKLIGGYSNNVENRLICELPVIVFGDHSRVVKYITFPFGAGADGIKVLEPKEAVLPKYLYYGTQYLVLRLRDRGYARHYQFIEKMEFSVVSIPEQERIIARIEELFSQLDASVDELNAAKERLKAYRQAVLKEAFDGTLTDSEKIGIGTLGRYIEKPRYGTSKKCDYSYTEKSKEVYRIPNIDYVSGRISHRDIKYSEFSENELADLKLECGDILIIRSNGSSSLVGRAAIIKETDKMGIFAGYLIRLRIKDKSSLLPEFLLYFLQSHDARIYIENKAKSTSGVHNINSTEISGLKIPIFMINDQQSIVSAIESRLSVCDSIEKTVDTALQQAEALRQSILKKAFEGGKL